MRCVHNTKRDLLAGGLTVGDLLDELAKHHRDTVVCFSLDGWVLPLETIGGYSLDDMEIDTNWMLELKEDPEEKLNTADVIVLSPTAMATRCTACGEVLDGAEVDVCRECEAERETC